MDNGCADVVRSGYLLERDLQTGIGPVNIKVPKVRSRDGEPETFRSALVPPYVRNTKSLEAALPWLHLNTASRQTLEGLFITRYNAAHDVQTRVVRPEQVARLRGFNYLAKVIITGVIFKDGIEQQGANQKVT